MKKTNENWIIRLHNRQFSVEDLGNGLVVNEQCVFVLDKNSYFC